jgi:hypothetical protein
MNLQAQMLIQELANKDQQISMINSGVQNFIAYVKIAAEEKDYDEIIELCKIWKVK